MSAIRLLIGICLAVVFNFANIAHAEKTLIVGTAADYEPLSFMQKNQPVGIEADFVTQIQSQSEKKFTIKVLPWKELIPALQRGDIDIIMSGMSITEPRKQQVEFTQPYMQIGQMAIFRVADAAKFNQPLAVLQPGIIVGYEANTSGADFIRNTGVKLTTHAYDNAEAGLAALMAGEIDCFVHDAPTSWNIARDRRYESLMSTYRPLTNEGLAWAVSKDNLPLRNWLDDQLKQMQDKGYASRILNRWIPVKVTVK